MPSTKILTINYYDALKVLKFNNHIVGKINNHNISSFNNNAVMSGVSSGSGPAITDLTGTTWLMNEHVSMSPLQGNEYQFNFNFYLTVDSTPGAGFDMSYNEDTGLYLDYINIDLAYDDNTWQNDAFKSITISGGTDVTNTNLIAWLQANATLRGNLISFNIRAASYYAEEGMTWGEWAVSGYNTIRARVSGDYIISGSTHQIAYDAGTPVLKTDTIISGTTYVYIYSGGGGGY